MTMLTEPHQIEAFQLLVIRAALRLETLGMSRSAGSIAPRVRELLNSKTRSKEKLLIEFDNRLREAGILSQ
jgi:hypothetical protein